MRGKQETGNRYGRLVVQYQIASFGKGALWSCLCDCGMTTVVSGVALRSGRTTCATRSPGRVRACGLTQHTKYTRMPLYGPMSTRHKRVKSRG